MVFNSNGQPEEELKHITALCNARVDGVIWEPVNAQSLEHTHLFSRQNISVHCLNAPEGFLSYEIDFEKAGCELAEKLIQTYTQETGCALTLVTHSLQQARRIADNVLFFYKGKLLEAGEANIALYHPKTLEAKQFLDFYGI